MRSYLIRTLNAMAVGLFGSLIIGVIIEQLGLLVNVSLIVDLGQTAKFVMGPAIGVAVAHALKAPPLVLAAAAAAGAVGAGTFASVDGAYLVRIGEPVGAFVAALVGIEVGRFLAGKTPVDILVQPAATVFAGGLTGVLISPAIASFMTALGQLINEATALHPFPMGIAVAVVMGMLLTLPISSAAIAISLGLSGLAAGAATVGCCAQMIGFATSSFKENRWSGLLAQGLGTSMLQIPNIVRNPRIWIPPTLTAAILGPFATLVFKMENVPTGAGMGTSGLIGQIGTLSAMGQRGLWGIIMLHFLAPALLTLVFAGVLRRLQWIKDGDMELRIQR